jgi:chemotaxis protein methyltransferase CheR
MTGNELSFIRSFVKERSGLDLAEDKGYLVDCRLGPIARQRGYASLSELIAALSRGADAALADQVVEAMTTNESSFFRDKVPFENFRNVMLPQLMQARGTQRQIRIWCAAASTGQEPYSLAITLEEDRARVSGWHIDILATDISTSVAERGRSGRYSQFEVQRGLPIQLLMKYFTQDKDTWQLNEPVRRMVRWKVFNLLNSYAPLGRFDIIFCRNVLIYFDRQTKIEVLGRLADALAPDGFLVLGAAETVVGLTDRFQPEPGVRGLYRPVAAGAGQPMLRVAAI